MFKKKVEFKGSAVVGGKDMKKLKKDVAQSLGIRCACATRQRARLPARTPPPPPHACETVCPPGPEAARTARTRRRLCFRTRSRSA